MSRYLTVFFAVTLVAVLSVAVAQTPPERPAAPPAEQPAAPTAGPQGPIAIGFSQCTVKEPWRVEFNRRMKEHAEKNYPNVELDILDADDRTEKQVGDMQALKRRAVHAILISPKESAGLTRIVREVSESGIPVVVLDRDVDYKGYDCFVGADNRVIGRAAGKVAVDLLGGPGKAKGVIYEICGGMASTPAQERKQGFHDVVDAEKGLKVIGGLDADWKKDKAKSIMLDALKANKEIDLVYAHNDPMAHGAYLAAKDAGRASEMKFIGIDALPDEGQRWVKSGELTATVLYPTPGEVGLDMALKILRREPVPKRVTLPTRIFTKENIDEGGEEVPLEPTEEKPEKPAPKGRFERPAPKTP